MNDCLTLKHHKNYLCPSCEWFSHDFYEQPPEGWQCIECEKRDAERRAAWVAFCAAAADGGDTCFQAEFADSLLAEYDARFPKRRV